MFMDEKQLSMSHEKTCDILDDMAKKGFVDAEVSHKIRTCFH